MFCSPARVFFLAHCLPPLLAAAASQATCADRLPSEFVSIHLISCNVPLDCFPPCHCRTPHPTINPTPFSQGAACARHHPTVPLRLCNALLQNGSGYNSGDTTAIQVAMAACRAGLRSHGRVRYLAWQAGGLTPPRIGRAVGSKKPITYTPPKLSCSRAGRLGRGDCHHALSGAQDLFIERAGWKGRQHSACITMR